MERKLYRGGKKIILVWKESYTGVERKLYRGGKKPIPVWKETYTGVERNFYRHPYICMMDVLKFILNFKKKIKNIQNMYNLILISKKIINILFVYAILLIFYNQHYFVNIYF